MPRVHTQTKSTRGKDLYCGRCGARIEPGEIYFSWSFRYGGPRANCYVHPPRPSELTQSKLSEVYAAIENAEDQLDGAESVEELRELVAEVAEAVQQVAEEYREASEPFGYQGENAERADELDSWANELQCFEPEEPHEAEEPVPLEAPEPDTEGGWPEETVAYYTADGTGSSRQVSREVYRHDFFPIGDETWVLQVYDEWFVDEDGRPEEDAGVTRRVDVRPPPESRSGGAGMIAGYAVAADRRARRNRVVAKPSEPRPALSSGDALSQAREAAAELIGGCPL